MDLGILNTGGEVMEERVPEYKNVLPECIRIAVEEQRRNKSTDRAAQKRRIKSKLFDLKQSLK